MYNDVWSETCSNQQENDELYTSDKESVETDDSDSEAELVFNWSVITDGHWSKRWWLIPILEECSTSWL